MKKNIGLFRLIFSPTCPFVLLALLVSSTGGMIRADDTTTASASAGITDAAILDVINRVAHHQLNPLKDGEYPSVKAPNALPSAQAATAPEGIAWSYPWGVTLYGLMRSTDVTGDKEVEKFVLDHNLICARYYNWLSGLRESG